MPPRFRPPKFTPPPPPKFVLDAVSKAVRVAASVHTKLYVATNGAIGGKLLGSPCILLTTTGAKSGIARTTPLQFAMDGDRYLLAGSNNGSDHDPGWIHNIEANPTVELQLLRDKITGRATVLRQGAPRYDLLFSQLNQANGGRYYGYQAKTDRIIPLVVVTPTP